MLGCYATAINKNIKIDEKVTNNYLIYKLY
jgi:hypothetical protein